MFTIEAAVHPTEKPAHALAENKTAARDAAELDATGGDTEEAPARFLMLRAPVSSPRPETVTGFATEAEARTAFAKWRNSVTSQAEWGEVARTGGGIRPAVVVWSGRPFPPVGEEELDSLGELVADYAPPAAP